MIRDAEYIRQMLLELEAADEPYLMMPIPLPEEEPAEVKKRYHMELLVDAGLLVRAQHGDDYRLTNQGHDFIEALRQDKIWQKTKEGVLAVGGATLGMMKDIAVGYLKREASTQLGLDLP